MYEPLSRGWLGEKTLLSSPPRNPENAPILWWWTHLPLSTLTRQDAGIVQAPDLGASENVNQLVVYMYGRQRQSQSSATLVLAGALSARSDARMR